MIRRLRRRHRRAAVLLVVLVPALLIGAVVVRPAPAVAPQPEALWLTRLAKGGTGIVLRVDDDTLVVTRTSVFGGPDLLLYWTPESPRVGADELPPGAQLLGAMPPGPEMRTALPPAARDRQGHIVLYSLAHERVDVAWPLESAE